MTSATETVMERIAAEIEEKVFKRRGSWWSLHLVDGPEALAGKEWRHGLFSRESFAKGYNAEVLVADKDGDMPMFEYDHGLGDWTCAPPYHASLDGAWAVVDAMHARGYLLELEADVGINGIFWTAQFGSHTSIAGEYTTAETAPLAICLAALSAIEASSASLERSGKMETSNG